MTVGIKLGNITDEIGQADFLHAFFSTISGNLEVDGWGTRFPTLLNKLYDGQLGQEDAQRALDELSLIQSELSKIGVDQVVWDIDDLKKSPPWGDEVSPQITSLSEYFITSTGRDLIEIMKEILQELDERGGVAEIVKY